MLLPHSVRALFAPTLAVPSHVRLWYGATSSVPMYFSVRHLSMSSVAQRRARQSKNLDGTVPTPTRARASKRPSTSIYTDAPMYTYNPPVSDEDISFCYPHLPHPSMWKSVFSFSKEQYARHRYFVANRTTVQNIVNRMGLDSPERQGMKTTIIEAYPGPGTFTRAFMEHPNVERVIAMENVPSFLAQLEHLQKDPALTSVSDKLRVIPQTGYSWDTYETLVEEGHLGHLASKLPKLGPSSPAMDWEAPCPLMFFAQLPNTVHGEQLFAQLIHAISSRFWLFKYGRMDMVFVCGETVALRSMASPYDLRTRAKLGATVQCLSTPEVLLPSDDMEPYAEHMYPSIPSIGPRVPVTSVFIPNSNISTGLQKRKLTTLKITPLREPLIEGRDMDSFEFLTRNLFVLKSKTVYEGLKHVAPGAHNILRLVAADHPRMRHRPQDVVLPDTPIVELSNRQWAALAEAFEKWPFRPNTYIDEGRVRRGLSDYLF